MEPAVFVGIDIGKASHHVVALTVGGHPLPVLRTRDGDSRFVGEPGTVLGLIEPIQLTESVVRAIQLRAENWPIRGELVLERAGVRQRVLRGDPNAITAFALVEHDFSGSLRTIAAPTLIIWGANDTIAPLRTGQALAAAIPRARLTVIEGAGHAPQVQFPDRFNPLLIDELDGRLLSRAIRYAGQRVTSRPSTRAA